MQALGSKLRWIPLALTLMFGFGMLATTGCIVRTHSHPRAVHRGHGSHTHCHYRGRHGHRVCHAHPHGAGHH